MSKIGGMLPLVLFLSLIHLNTHSHPSSPKLKPITKKATVETEVTAIDRDCAEFEVSNIAEQFSNSLARAKGFSRLSTEVKKEEPISRFIVSPSGREIVAVLSHSVSVKSRREETRMSGSGNFDARLKNLPKGVKDVTVKRVVSRTIIASKEARGTVKFNGQEISLEESYLETWSDTFTLNEGDLVPPAEMANEVTLAGSGEVVIQTRVVISIDDDRLDIGDCGGDPPEDEDDENDDEDDPEDGDCDEGADGGDALHVRITTGNVWTRIPVLKTFANDRVELDITLRYDSLRRNIDSPVGYGWNHGYDITLASSTGGSLNSFPPQIIFTQGNGRRNAFTKVSGNNYNPPPGRNQFDLEWVTNHFEVQQANGMRYVFDSSGRITEKVDRRGRTTRFDYGANGKLSRITSPHGREVDFAYNGSNRVSSITAPDNSQTQLGYDGSGNLDLITDPEMNSVSYIYDGSHRITRETLKNGTWYTAEYTSNSRTLRDSLGNVVVSLSSSQGFPSTNTSTINAGFVTMIDGRNQSWQVKRDTVGRLQQVTSPTGKIRKRIYGTSGVNKGLVIRYENQRGLSRNLSWDSYGNVWQRRDQANHTETFQFNHAIKSLATRRTEPDGDIWDFGYDTNGDLLQVTDPLDETLQGAPADAVLTYSYQTHGAMDGVSVGGDPLPGRVKKITATDRNGVVNELEYDTSGNLVTVTSDVGGLNEITTLQYDPMGQVTQRIVERGDIQVITEWDYDDMGRMVQEIKDPGGLNLVTSSQYDGHGNLLSFTNPRGVTNTYTHDHRNRQDSKTDASATLALTSTWGYDGNSNITSQTDPENRTTQFEYDDQNYLVRRVDAENYETLFGRDGVGNLTSLDRALSPGTGGPYYSETYVHDAVDRLTNRTVDPSGLSLSTDLEYTPPGGCGCSGASPERELPHKVLDAENRVRYIHYDALDRRTKVVRKVGDTADNGGDADDAVLQYEYDPMNNLTAIQLPTGERTEYGYDARNRRTTFSAIDPVNGNMTMSLIYNGAGNVIQANMANGNQVSLQYDAVNRLTLTSDVVGVLSSLAYDDNGNVTQRGDGLGHTWTYQYDDVDRLIREYDPLVETPVDQYISHVYDGAGNRIGSTDSEGVQVTHVFDDINRLITEIEDAGGLDQSTTNWTFNGLGLITGLTDNDSNTTTVGYDDAGRPDTIVYPDEDGTGAGTVHLTWNGISKLFTKTDQNNVVTSYTYNDLHQLERRDYSTGRFEAFSYDKSGRTVRTENDTAIVDFGYDAFGRISSTTQTYVSDGATYSTGIAYQYLGFGLLKAITTPSGRIVFRAYDKRDRLFVVSGGTGIGASWTFDAADRRITADTSNGVNGIFDFDINDRISRIQHANGVATLFETEYGYTSTGTRTFSRDLVNPLFSQLAVHDNRDRLDYVLRGSLNTAGDSIVQLLFDPSVPSYKVWNNMDSRGNWLSTDTLTNGAWSFDVRTTNGANEYLTVDPDGAGAQVPVPLIYDDNGNLTVDLLAGNAGDVGGPSGQIYNYNEQNRLTRVGRASDNQTVLDIGYDAFGRRVESTDHLAGQDPCGSGGPVTTRHILLGLNTIEEYAVCSGGDTLAREFIWSDGFPETVAMIDHTGAGGLASANPEVIHYQHDVLGNVVMLTDASGSAVEHYHYDPYGTTYIRDAGGNDLAESAYGNPYAWTGQRLDASARLYQFFARSHSPRLGRWLQRDPLMFADGVNPYQYVNSSPLSYFDPFGFDDVAIYDPNDGVRPPGIADSGDFQEAADDYDHVIAATSVEDAANQLEALAASGVEIDNVYIFDHGNSVDGQQLGNDYIDPEDPDWERLGDTVEEDGEIHLAGCNVGVNEQTVQDYADGAGRTTDAYDDFVLYRDRWFWNYDWWSEGNKVTCEPTDGEGGGDGGDDDGDGGGGDGKDKDKKKDKKKDKGKGKGKGKGDGKGGNGGKPSCNK